MDGDSKATLMAAHCRLDAHCALSGPGSLSGPLGTRKLKIAKMASDLHRRAWEGAEEATTTFLTSSTSSTRDCLRCYPRD